MTCAAGSSPWGPRSTIPKSHQAPSTEHHRQEPQNSAFVYKIEGVDGALFTFPAWKQHKCPTNGLMRSSLSPRRRSQADAWQSQADGCLATPADLPGATPTPGTTGAFAHWAERLLRVQSSHPENTIHEINVEQQF